MLGNGAELKRDTIPVAAPSKPPRSGSFRKHNTVNQEESGNHEKPPNDQQRSEKSEPHNKVSTTIASEEAAASVAAEVEKESLDQRGANEGGVPAIKLSDSVGSVPAGNIEALDKSQGVDNSLPVVHKSAAPANAIPNDHLPSNTVDEVKDHSDDHTQGGEVWADSQGKEAQNEDDRQDRDAARVHDKKPRDTEVQNHAEAQDIHDREETQTQDMTQNQSEMKSIKEEPESTKPITATAVTTTTSSTTMTMGNSTEKTTTNQINESHSNSTTPKESESKPNASAVEEQQPTRKSSFGTSKSFRAEDSLFETALLLGKLASCVLSSLRHLCFS